MPNDRLVSRALDNRVGCFVAAEAARLVAEAGGAPGDVIALAVVQEETTFAGSRTSAFALEPDVAIAVDVTFATDQPGVDLGPITKHTIGSGPVIARGTTLHPRVFDLLYDDRASRRRSRSRSSRSDARPAPTPTRSTSPAGRADRDRVGTTALHALTGRDASRCRHRRRREADRGVRAAADAGHVVRALSDRTLLLFDIDGTLLGGRHGRAP